MTIIIGIIGIVAIIAIVIVLAVVWLRKADADYLPDSWRPPEP